MLRNYLITVLHGLCRQPVFSAIKVFSLSIGLASSILVYMHVSYVNSFDKHIPNWQNTYRLVTYMRDLETGVPFRLGMTSNAHVPQLLLDYPQIESLAMTRFNSGAFYRENDAIESTFLWTQPDIIEIFSLEFVQGDPDSALDQPGSMIITESMARKFFGDENPMGQVLTLDEQRDVRVTGVIRDMPKNSHVRPEILISVNTDEQMGYGPDSWMEISGTVTYLTLPDKATAEALNADLGDFIARNLPERLRGFADQVDWGLELQAISEIYLNPLDGNGPGNETSTQRTVLTGLIIFSILILLTSCINYVNLTQAQIGQRIKEIGVRKSLGARNIDIFRQFLFESVLLTGVAVLVALPLAAIFLPVYTSLTATEFGFSDVLEADFVITLIVSTVAVGVVAGFLPALSLSRLQAADILKRTYIQNTFTRFTKLAVTVMQFTLAVSLVLLSIAIYFQIEHLKDADPGFNKDGLLILDTGYDPNNPEAFQYSALRNELRQHPGIASVTATWDRPPTVWGSNPWRVSDRGAGANIQVNSILVDEHFIETYQMRLVAGRNFSNEFPSEFAPLGSEFGAEDHQYGVIITQSTARRFGFDTPAAAIGRSLQLNEEFNYKVIGVVEDIRFSGGTESPSSLIGIISASQDPLRFLSIRITPSRLSNAIEHIDAVWARHRPGVSINRVFYSQTYHDIIYARTNGISKAALFSSIITGIIAALGLYALAAYSSQKRTKEVGVRKVLGADTPSIIFLLVGDFVKPVLVACILSLPVAYYLIADFYDRFLSQADFHVFNFIAVIGGVIILSILTVVSKSIQAANADPVKSLKFE